MANLQTMLQVIAQRLHQPNSGEFQTEANLAVIAAIGQLKERPWPWNTAEFSFATENDDRDYSFDSHIATGARYLLDPIVLEIGQDADDSILLEHWSQAKYERCRLGWEDQTGDPYAYAVWGETIYLHPTPDGAHNVRGRFIKALTEPSSTWNGSSWTHSSGTLTSEWFEFDHGFELVCTLACHLLAMRYLAMDADAQRFLVAHQQEAQAEISRHGRRETLGPQLEWYL